MKGKLKVQEFFPRFWANLGTSPEAYLRPSRVTMAERFREKS